MQCRRNDAIPRRGLFHLHTTYSDGQLAVSDVVALVKSRNCSIVSILDHACVLGCIELYKSFGFDMISVIGYEHTIGNTDIGLLGINEVFPLWWNIQRISDEVHDRGGRVVYLHPMRGGVCHIAELNSWMDCGYVDGWEYRNNLNSKALPRDLFELPSVWGCDLHDEREIANIPAQGMVFPESLLPNTETKLNSVDLPRYLCRKAQEFELFFGRCVLEVSGFDVRLRLSFDCDWGVSAPLDYDGDCVEIAVGNGERDSFAELHSISYGASGLLWATAKLTRSGVCPCARREVNALPRFTAIDKKNYELNVRLPKGAFAFSVSVKSIDSPALKRFSWPAPVWPPRQIYNLAQI